MQIESDMTQELHEWGKWANACPSRSLNYPGTEPYSIKKGGLGLSITEDRALEIDQAIAFLFTGDEAVLKLFKLYFVCGFSLRDIESHTEFKKDQARRVIDNSVCWITGYFFGKHKAA